MHRSGTQEREYQLQAWDASLVERQQALEAVMVRFQARVAQDAKDAERIRKEIEVRTAALHKREVDVAAREKAVALAEESLLQVAKSLQAQQAAVENAVTTHSHEVNALLDSLEGNDNTVAVTPGSENRGPSANDSFEEEEKELHVFQPQRRATAVPAASTDDRSPPSAPKVPKIAMMSLATGGGGSASKRYDDGSNNVTPTRQLETETPPSRSPQLYEGPVDPRLPSMVEEIQEDEPTPTKPRGLRSSPQFHPMDPNDSGLGFLRPTGGHNFDEDGDEEEEEEEEGEHHEWDEDDDDSGRAALQDQLDTAIHFLVSEGVVNEEELEGWLQSGASAQQIIALYHEQQSRLRPDDGDTPRRFGRDPQHDDDYEYQDGDEDLMYDDEDADEDGGERHRSESSSAGEPIRVDAHHEVLEDGDISPNRQNGGDGGEHNESLTSHRVRGGSASPRSATTTLAQSGAGGEGSPRSAAATVAASKHAFDSFDDDSDEDDNEF
ncbi:Hypothetical protein, putative [Bodo saltans]|uniref:Uncharacterized protein n=1 Tax=Bodo saltans TaxID=75058 RepID=A0A0S4JBC5_BODSA|nr:Hypothetical protein, putative [Bodo saltans]|eukprot:CUG87243.1 Hypothetical protein, putative [Bodo saltans]